MGTHPRSRDIFNWKRTDCDVWLFNEAANLKKTDGTRTYPKADVVIQLHDEAIWKSPKNRSDEKHYEWLKNNKTATVYMQKSYPEVPKSVKYPIEKILELTKNVHLNINGKEKIFKYFSSSLDYALALVALMSKEGKTYKRVEIWGVELEMESEYQYQRTGFGFWSGYLAALGIDLFLYNSIFDAPMYGYEGDVAISSREIEQRINDLKKQLGSDKDTYTSKANDFLNTKLSQLLNGDVSLEIRKEFLEIKQRGETAGILNGKINESARYLEKAQAMEEKAGASVFSLGEFDGSRILFNNQYMKLLSEANQINSQMTPVLKKLLNLKKGSQKRKRTLNEYGKLMADLMNKNMILFHLAGAVQENQFYIDSVKLSIDVSLGKNKWQ